MIKHLNDPSRGKRDDALNKLHEKVSSHNLRNTYVLFANPQAIFKGLARVLSDDDTWETKYQCVKLITLMIPSLNDCLDECMNHVMPSLIALLEYPKITLSNASVIALKTYAGHTTDFQLILDSIIRHGLEIKNIAIKKAVISNVWTVLLTEEQHSSDRNLQALVESLASQLFDNIMVNDREIIWIALDKIKKFVGHVNFDSYIKDFPPNLQKRYLNLVGIRASPKVSPSNQFADEDLKFGIISNDVLTQLNNENDFKMQGIAAEELKQAVVLPGNFKRLLSHMSPFLNFIKDLLDDKANFCYKVIIVALEIIEFLVDQLGTISRDYLRPILSALTRQMSEQKPTVRKLVSSIATKLVQHIPPKSFLAVLCENLSHKNWRVRQETLNIIIMLLIINPSYMFELGSLCQSIVHTLIDPKKHVRWAALECFALIAQTMGAGKQQQLVMAVDSLEQKAEGEGAMAAVQARIARRQIPIFKDGVVEYAIHITSSSAVSGIDIDWINSGSSSASVSSARSGYSSVELDSFRSVSPTSRNRFSKDQVSRCFH